MSSLNSGGKSLGYFGGFMEDAGFVEVDLVDDAGGTRLLPAPQKPSGGNV